MKNSMNIDLETIECGKNFYVYQEIENNDEITFHLKLKPNESRYASSRLACDLSYKKQETSYSLYSCIFLPFNLTEKYNINNSSIIPQI